MGQNYDFTNYDFNKLLDDYNTSNEVLTQADTDINFTNNDNLLDLDNLLQIQDENVIDYTDSYNTTLNDLSDLQDTLNMNMGVDSFTTTDNTLNNTLDLTALDHLKAIDTTTNLSMTDYLDATT